MPELKVTSRKTSRQSFRCSQTKTFRLLKGHYDVSSLKLLSKLFSFLWTMHNKLTRWNAFLTESFLHFLLFSIWCTNKCKFERAFFLFQLSNCICFYVISLYTKILRFLGCQTYDTLILSKRTQRGSKGFTHKEEATSWSANLQSSTQAWCFFPIAFDSGTCIVLNHAKFFRVCVNNLNPVAVMVLFFYDRNLLTKTDTMTYHNVCMMISWNQC